MQRAVAPEPEAAILLSRRWPQSLTLLYVITTVTIYVSAVANTPRAVLDFAIFDDETFMTLGRYLSEGAWLGPFGSQTLLKGPGFPAFLAVSHWLGLSYSVAVAVLHCGAVVFVTIVTHRFVKSTLLSLVLFTLLMWVPLPLTAYMLRVFRESIYYAQVLIWLATFAWALFGAANVRTRLFYSAISGLFLGWLWLTREEGLWLVPGILVLVAAAIVGAHRNRALPPLAAVLIVALGVFGVVQVTFRTVNWWAYGMFVGVDFKEANYQWALREIHSVRSGGIVPFISATRATRELIYAVSPTFASLKDYFEGADSAPWAAESCRSVPQTCGDIGAGFFVWELRQAAAKLGYYASPQQASAFFGKIAREIEAACDRGALICEPQPIAEIPPTVWGQFASVPEVFARLVALLVFHPRLDADQVDSASDRYEADLEFLNFPLNTGAMPDVFTLRGWYYQTGSEWFDAEVKTPRGQNANVGIIRNDGPDIAAYFKDPAASHQRFVLRVPCEDACILQLSTSQGDRKEIHLGDLHEGLINLGAGRVYLDTVERKRPAGVGTLPVRASRALRDLVVRHYDKVFIPWLLAGILAFMAVTVFYWREAKGNGVYAIAFGAWTLVLSRAALLIVMQITVGAGINPNYFLPANFLIVVAATFSIAVLMQARTEARRA